MADPGQTRQVAAFMGPIEQGSYWLESKMMKKKILREC